MLFSLILISGCGNRKNDEPKEILDLLFILSKESKYEGPFMNFVEEFKFNSGISRTPDGINDDAPLNSVEKTSVDKTNNYYTVFSVKYSKTATFDLPIKSCTKKINKFEIEFGDDTDKWKVVNEKDENAVTSTTYIFEDKWVMEEKVIVKYNDYAQEIYREEDNLITRFLTKKTYSNNLELSVREVYKYYDNDWIKALKDEFFEEGLVSVHIRYNMPKNNDWGIGDRRETEYSEKLYSGKIVRTGSYYVIDGVISLIIESHYGENGNEINVYKEDDKYIKREKTNDVSSYIEIVYEKNVEGNGREDWNVESNSWKAKTKYVKDKNGEYNYIWSNEINDWVLND